MARKFIRAVQLRQRVQIHEDGGRERWRDVPGYAGFYRVSDWGRVKSLTRKVRHNWGGVKIQKGRVFQRSDKNAYQGITLRKNGVKQHINRHCLVWWAFRGIVPDGYEINHKDGRKGNDRLSNLELVTRGENMRHAFRTGLMPLGEDRRHSKLTREQVKELRARYRRGETLVALAERFCVNRRTIADAVWKKTWKHVR